MVIEPVTVPPLETILEARLQLAARDPGLAVAHRDTPPFQWRLRAGGFPGLTRMVIEQQISTTAAAAILRRFEAGLGEVTPARALELDEEALRALGLSLPKARYVRAIAQAHLEGRADLDALSTLSDEAAVAALSSIKGVGRWTAETYLMFCEGRLDLFPAGDVALQEALRRADGAPARLAEKALYARAEAWRPYRGVAAHLLWAYYAGLKRGDIAAPELEPA